MMKKLVYISILSLLLLSSCRSKRMITVSLPQPVMQADSTQLGDTIGLPARLSPMFTFDQSDLRNVRRQPAKGEVKKQQIKKTAPVQKVIVPSRWFQHSEAPDIYPTGWIKVPVS